MNTATIKSLNAFEICPMYARAEILLCLDHVLRARIDDENLFDIWLTNGVPDGVEDPDELGEVSAEDFEEMYMLANRLLWLNDHPEAMEEELE